MFRAVLRIIELAKSNELLYNLKGVSTGLSAQSWTDPYPESGYRYGNPPRNNFLEASETRMLYY
jgi:hypothetical protein